MSTSTANLRPSSHRVQVSALDGLLRAHLPYPAMVLDRHGTVVLANAACARLYGDNLAGTNLARRFLTDPAAQRTIVNWPDIAWASLDRLRHQRDQAPTDDTLAELVALAETALADTPRPPALGSELVLCPWFRIGDQIIKTIGIAARFDHPADVTLDELRIELIYPRDPTATQFFQGAVLSA